MPTKNDGKAAERAFESHWNSVGHCQRLYDAADLRGRNGGRHVGDYPKPSDYLVSSPTEPLHFAEVKSVMDKTRFPFGCITDGQHNAAMKEAKKGSGRYIFYIFSYHLGKWFYMSCREYAVAINRGDRSKPFEELSPWSK